MNTLEAVYGQESSFGDKNFMGNRGSSKAAGHFQQKKDSARENGLKELTSKNDERFDIDTASISAAKQLKLLDNYFRLGADLGELSTIIVKDINERKKFALAAYNGGQGRIAKAGIMDKSW